MCDCATDIKISGPHHNLSCKEHHSEGWIVNNRLYDALTDVENFELCVSKRIENDLFKNTKDLICWNCFHYNDSSAEKVCDECRKLQARIWLEWHRENCSFLLQRPLELLSWALSKIEYLEKNAKTLF